MVSSTLFFFLCFFVAKSAGASIEFPESCPNEDAEWCSSSDQKNKICNFKRPDGSVVYKLFDNIWYNCPQHCFGCKFPGNELNITQDELEATSRDFKVPLTPSAPPVILLEYWLERKTIKEHSGACEDAASFVEPGEKDVCTAWKALGGDDFCNEPSGLDSINTQNPKQDFSFLKTKGYWWCQQSCDYC